MDVYKVSRRCPVTVTRIYVKEVFIKHKVLSKIILDRDLRFIAVF